MTNPPKKVLLLHGWGGKNEDHWLTWLEAELIKKEIPVFFPKIPNNYNPKCQKWVNHIAEYVKEFQPTIVIGHSLGALAWWHFYQQTSYKVSQVISIAPPTFESFPNKMKSFFPLPTVVFDENIHTIVYAKDDPNIKQEDLENIAKKSHSKLIQRPTGGHLDHYTKTRRLEALLDWI